MTAINEITSRLLSQKTHHEYTGKQMAFYVGLVPCLSLHSFIFSIDLLEGFLDFDGKRQAHLSTDRIIWLLIFYAF